MANVELVTDGGVEVDGAGSVVMTCLPLPRSICRRVEPSAGCRLCGHRDDGAGIDPDVARPVARVVTSDVPAVRRRGHGHHGEGEHLHRELTRGDHLEHGGHADGVGTERCEHRALRRGLVVRAGKHRVDALDEPVMDMLRSPAAGASRHRSGRRTARRQRRRPVRFRWSRTGPCSRRASSRCGRRPLAWCRPRPGSPGPQQPGSRARPARLHGPRTGACGR